MSRNSMSDLVNKVNTGKSDRTKEYARASEWPKCHHAGCPLITTIKDDKNTCTYHHKEHGFNADCITEAVKEYEKYLTKYTQMIHWNVKTWKEKRSYMMGWPVLPATEFEMTFPTMYLQRFKTWIDKSIKERAEEIYKGSP